MSKTQRIENLEREVDQLHVTIGRLSDRLVVLESAPRPVAAQPFSDRVRSEFEQRWGWLGDLVGL